MTEIEALVTLNALPKLGPVGIRQLLSRFGTALDVLQADVDALSSVIRCKRTVELLSNWSEHANPAHELEECERHGIEIITPDSSQWPATLIGVKDAPVLLYVWGTLRPQEDRSPVAVIGSRKTTNYGRSVTTQLSRDLAHSGHTIISGMALGIDTLAHRAALLAGQRTIAVLGSGLCSLYPKQNIELAREISQQGAVVSEYPLHTNPDKQTFPQRNRIVAAWAKGVLVTEMPERSGAMITANFAKDRGRPIFAVPGPIDRTSSAGCNLLIQQGAHLVTEAVQITSQLEPQAQQLDFLNSTPSTSSAPDLSGLSTEKRAVYEQLTSHEQSVEELHQLTQMPVPALTMALLELELDGLAQQLPGMNYTLV